MTLEVCQRAVQAGWGAAGKEAVSAMRGLVQPLCASCCVHHILSLSLSRLCVGLHLAWCVLRL